MKKLVRMFAATGVAGAGLALMALPAGAHISPDKSGVPAGSYNSVTLTVPHGCEESPTKAIAIQIPEGVLSLTPQVHPGWDIATEMEQLATPVEGEGDPITERVSKVTFTAQAGNELNPHYRDTFTVGFKTPDTEGEYLFFKTIQTCVAGETAWIEEYTGDGPEPDHPAPALEVTAAGPEEGSDDSSTETTVADDGSSDDESASTDDNGNDDDSDSAKGLAIGGLAVGLLGLATGGFALVRTRKPTS
jgi:uncharacterized protein YcnI